MNFLDALEAARVRRGLLKKDLIERSGVCQTSYYSYYNRKRYQPTLPSAEALAAVVGIYMRRPGEWVPLEAEIPK